MKTLIKNIKGLAGILEEETQTPLRGNHLATLNQLNNAYLIIENDKIAAFGEMSNLISQEFDKEIDTKNRFVLPAWCDSHTHIVYAASREKEFVDRINGLTYQEIANRGGGILNSAKRLRETSKEDLITSALKRIKLINQTGTGALEIKSGYGLTIESEIKMLEVIRELKKHTNTTIQSTLLAAHAIPEEFKANRKDYINIIIKEIIPIVAKEQLADYIDVFCETNYFTVNEMVDILDAGHAHGLLPKVHVNQFTSIGGLQAAIKHNALSVDHLEEMTQQDIIDLANSDTIGTILPSCSFFLGIPYAPAKEILQKNGAIAIATDFNPGSTPSGNIPFALSLACIKQKLLPAQAINAATINGAAAMNLQDQLGSITVGKTANLIITKEIESMDYIPYSFGENCVDQLILKGKLTEEQS